MGVKMTFGIQPHHIEIIQKEIARWNAIELSSMETVDMTFCKEVWKSCGELCGWEPFTLALAYFEWVKENS